jgi:hypothetical protein
MPNVKHKFDTFSLTRRWRARRAAAGRREVAAPGRPRPLLAGGAASARPTYSVAVCCGGLPRRRVVAPVSCWPRLAPRPAVSSRIVAGSCRVHPDLAGCLEGGRSSLEVAGSPSSLPSHQHAAGVPLGLATSMAMQWRPWQ